jgi:hypothetical protein
MVVTMSNSDSHTESQRKSKLLNKQPGSDMKVIVTKALAGCGKTHELYHNVEKAATNGSPWESIIVLSFNRSLRDNAMTDLSHLVTDHPRKSLSDFGRSGATYRSSVTVKTIHGLAYLILKKTMRLPKWFKKEDRDEVEAGWRHEDAKAAKYDELIFTALEICIDDPWLVAKALGKITEIFIDEYQDLRRDHIELIRLVANTCRTQALHLYGDPNQMIYRYSNKFAKPVPIEGLENRIVTEIGNNFDSIGSDWRVKLEDIETRVLRTNHRSTRSVLKAVNHFLRSNFGTASGLDYEIDQQAADSDQTKVRLFSNTHEEMEWVRKEIMGLPVMMRVTIIAQEWKTLRPYESLGQQIQRSDIVTTTIHQMKGLDADVIFFVGVHANTRLQETPTESIPGLGKRPKLNVCELVRDVDRDTVNLVYTAISRAKQKLFICTSHPESPLECFRNCNEVDFEDRQKVVHEGWKRLPSIVEGGNFTLKKVKTSHIDSIVLQVNDSDVPFPSYVPKGNVPKRVHFGQGYTTEVDGLSETILHINRSHGSGWYTFEMFDLNPLKLAGYDDYQIVKRCANVVIDFFDHRIPLNAINTLRLDIAKYLAFDNMITARETLRGIDESVRGTGVQSVRDHTGYDYLKAGKQFLNWRNSTYYANYLRQRCGSSHPVVLRIYSTDLKNRGGENSNSRNGRSLTRRNVWKCEWQLKQDAVGRNYSLGDNDNIERLMNKLRESPDLFNTVFDTVSQHFGVDFPDDQV